MKTVDASPHASSLIEGMRDFGYTLDSALADIVDNSVTACATRVDIYSEMFGADPVIAVIDDGKGMSKTELLEALRPGSRNPREERIEGDLGRFGLGLKTASFSQCRRLTVITRVGGRTSAARWDLDRVAAEDKWLLELPEDVDAVPFSRQLGSEGTAVIWEKLDRIVGEEPDDSARQAGNLLLDEAAGHLELVFHRFLAGERGLPKLDITMNGRDLKELDPFRESHRATIVDPVEEIRFKGSSIRVQGFTLPHHSKVTAADWERFGGREGYLKNQGFYVYRSGRLIIHGTWFGLARQTELTKLSRVRIDLPNSLDADWKIDVRKATAHPPREVRDRLRTLTARIGAGSKRVYTHKGQRLVDDARAPVWVRIQKDGSTVFSVNRDHPVIKRSLREDSDGDAILTLVEASLPLDALLADLGSSPEQVVNAQVPDSTLSDLVVRFITSLREMGMEDDEILGLVEASEPFRSGVEALRPVFLSLGLVND